MRLEFSVHGVVVALLATSGTLAVARDARAFSHIVRQGETLASIATRVYGGPRFETVIAGANALDANGGAVIVPGMRLELPAPGHHRVVAGETWETLALSWLGNTKRVNTIAHVNDAIPWVPPAEGLEIVIPPVIAHISSENESLTAIAARYLANGNDSWKLAAFNGRPDGPVQRGEVVLVPLGDLTLTSAGVEEARESEERALTEGATSGLETQKKIDAELVPLLAEVRGGRFVEALARGNRLLGTGELTRPELSTIHRALLECYVALDAVAAASGACAAWRANEPSPKLDATNVSPKIRAACAK